MIGTQATIIGRRVSFIDGRLHSSRYTVPAAGVEGACLRNTASRATVHAFSESRALTLEPLGVRACLVVPGRPPETAVGKKAQPCMTDGSPKPSLLPSRA